MAGQPTQGFLTWIDLHTGKQVRQRTLHFKARATKAGLRALLAKLSSAKERQRFAQECKVLQKNAPNAQLQWRSASSKQASLQGLNIPLSVKGMKEKFRLIYEEKRGEDRHLLTLLLAGSALSWPLHAALSFPEQGSVHHLDCTPHHCLVEIAYKGPVQVTHLLHFAPHEAIARLLHARGYKLHDAKQYAKARRDFATAWRLDPAYSDAGYNLACAQALDKAPAAAAATLKRLYTESGGYLKLACKDQDLISLHKPYPKLFAYCKKPKPKPKTKKPKAPNETPSKKK